MTLSKMMIAAAVSTMSLVGMAQAAPLVQLSLVGSTTGAEGSYSATVNAQPGDTVFFKVVGQLAAIGTSNTQGSTVRTITSKTALDGIIGASIDINASSAINYGARSLQNGYAAGLGAGVGTPNADGTNLDNVRPLQLGSIQGGTAPVDILTGSFTFSGASDVLLSAGWNSPSGSGSFRYNNGSNVLLTNAFATSADPIIGFSGLTVAVPEPTSVAAIGLLSAAFLRRRRAI